MRPGSLLTVLALVSVGCGDESNARRSELLARECPTRESTLVEGIAGCTTTTDDVGKPVTLANPDFPVEVFFEQPPVDPKLPGDPVASTASDGMGFYELSLPPGRYFVCTSFRRCVERDVAAGEVLRLNYDFSNAPGWY